jgi:hypothetical protein
MVDLSDNALLVLIGQLVKLFCALAVEPGDIDVVFPESFR